MLRLQGNTTVINGVVATEVVGVDANTVMATVPLGATSGRIEVTTAYGTASSQDKFKVTADLATTSVVELQAAGQEFVAYPNPFSDKVTISFTLKNGGEYSAAMYDAKGALIALRRKGILEAGERNTVEIDGSGLANGMYLIKIQSSEGMQTSRIILDRK